MILSMNLGVNSYDIRIERGALGRIGEYFNLNRKVLIVTDSGVPEQYAKAVASAAQSPYIEIFEQGESHKNMETYQAILARLVEERFSRKDCVVAVGGGVCGDMAGFAAASYMRGIDFYNVPTTLLAQVDSSIGGKVAIDFKGYKNIVGAFYQPKGVLIDPDVLSTLAPRQISNGLAEVIKMAATSDAALFEWLEEGEPLEDIERMIHGALTIKKDVVEQDEKETGLRRVLNFGHTIGHAIESVAGLEGYYHGECVGLGMLAMAAPQARARIEALLKRFDLPCSCEYDRAQILAAIEMDKKVSCKDITVVYLPEIGQFEFQKYTVVDLKRRMEAELQ